MGNSRRGGPGRLTILAHARVGGRSGRGGSRRGFGGGRHGADSTLADAMT